MNIKTKYAVLVMATLLSAAVFSTAAFSADPMLGTGGYNTQLRKMTMMKMVDANGDHMVTITEFDTFNTGTFEELDKNKDGVLDENEWVGTEVTKTITLATGGYSREIRSMKMMVVMDANADHKVTKDEFLAFQRSVFNTMDASGDKQLDAHEWAAKIVGGK